jgi:hypothetical protein
VAAADADFSPLLGRDDAESTGIALNEESVPTGNSQYRDDSGGFAE